MPERFQGEFVQLGGNKFLDRFPILLALENPVQVQTAVPVVPGAKHMHALPVLFLLHHLLQGQTRVRVKLEIHIDFRQGLRGNPHRFEARLDRLAQYFSSLLQLGTREANASEHKLVVIADKEGVQAGGAQQ